MKYILSFLLLFLGFYSYAQTEYTPNLVGRAVISQTGGSGTYWQVDGNFVDESGAYDGSTISIGDLLYFTDSGNGFFLPVQQVVSLAPPSFSIRVTNTGITLISGVPTTIGAILRPTTNLGLPYYVSGISSPDQQTLINYLVFRIDSLAGVPEITDYIGTYDVAPAVPASSNTGETWRNSVGELYYSDGTSWYTDKEIKYSSSSLLNQSSGRYKIGIDTVGTDTIYISNNGTFRRFSTSATTNLDEAYNNFGTNPALLTVDNAQGQGDLQIETSGVSSVIIDNKSTGRIEIRRNGDAKVTVDNQARVGLNKASPSSGVDIGSSLGKPISLISATNWTLGEGVVYSFNNEATQTIVLPTASTCPNRVYVVVNPSNFDKNISSYVDLNGSTSTILLSHSALTLQSDGTSWRSTSKSTASSVSTIDGTTIDFSTVGVDLTAEVKSNSLDSTHVMLGSLSLKNINQSSASTGQVIKWDGMTWNVGNDENNIYYAGTGISISNDTIYNSRPFPSAIGNPSTTPNPKVISVSLDTLYVHYADDITPGVLVASGDVSPAGATAQQGLQVDGLKGRVISSDIPDNGDVYKWSTAANKWVPQPDSTGANIDSVRVISNNSGIVVKVNTTSSPATEVTLNAIEQGGATTNQVLKWDGSSWVPNADNSGTGIDTLPDYTTLRSYAGSANMIYLTRSKNKGLFVRSASGTDNGGTIIVASNGVKWSRIVYNSTYRPEWWNENPTDTVYTNEINQANLLASANKGTVLFELNYAVDSLYNYFGQGYCIEAKSNVVYDVRGSIYLKSNAITAGRKLAVFVGWPGSHDIKFTGSGNIHMNTANNPNGVFGQETGQGIEVYGDTTTPTRNYTIEHLRFTGTFGNPINFKGGAPQTYAAPKHKDIYIHDVKYENFGEGAQIADAQNVYVSNCTGLTNSDYTFGDCFEFVRVKNAKIDGCYFRACCGGSGIDLFSAQETTVSNCTIINGSNGIDIQPDRFVVPAFTHSKNIIISNVTHDGQGESGQGINMSNNANTKLSNVFISDCYLTNSLVGISVGPQADTMPGPVVISNTRVEKCQKGVLLNYVKDVSILGGRLIKNTSYGLAIERNYMTGLGLYGVLNMSGTVIDSNNVGIYANITSNIGISGNMSANLCASNTNLFTWAESTKNSPITFKNERSIVKRATPSALGNYSGIQTLRMTGSIGVSGFVGYFHGERLTVTGTSTGTSSLGHFPTDPGGLNLMNRNTFTPDSMLFVTFEYDKWNNRWNEVSRAKDYVGTLQTGAIPFLEATGQKKYDAPNLYWNDNKKLGIGTSSPASLPGWSGSTVHIYDAAGLPSLNLSSGTNANVGLALEGSTRGNLWTNNGLDLTFSRSGSSSPLRIRSNYTGSAVTLFSLDPGTNIPQWLTTSAYKLPSGTDAQRPAGQVGFIRHNTTTNNFEIVRSGVTYENIVSTPISDTHTTNDVLTWNGTGWVSQAATGGIGGSIASTQIAYGSGTNTITGNSNFVYSGGNVGIGTTSTTARINVVGSGATSGTYTAIFHNSSGTNNALRVRDDGKIGMGTADAQMNGTLNIEMVGGLAENKVIYFSNAGGWSDRWLSNYQSATNRGMLLGGKNISAVDVNPLRIDHYPSGRVAVNLPTTEVSSYSFEVGGTNDTDGLVVSRQDNRNNNVMLNVNTDGDGILRSKSGYWTLGDIDVNLPTQNPNSILHLFGPASETEDNIFAIEKNGGYGATGFYQWYSGGNIGLKIRRFAATTYTPWITTWSNNAANEFYTGINNESPQSPLHIKYNGGTTTAITKSEWTNTGQAGDVRALYGQITTGSADNNVTKAVGVQGEVIMSNVANTNYNHNGVVGILTASNSGTYNNSSNNLGYSAGYFRLTQTAGTVPSNRDFGAILAEVITSGGGAADLHIFKGYSTINSPVTNNYGVEIKTPGGTGVIGTDYGLRISPRRGTTKWGVYIDSDNSYFGGSVGISTSPTRTLDVNGELRIRDLVTTTPTQMLVADNNGVVSSATLGAGLSIVSGVLTATGSNTDLTFSGTSSPVTLNSSSGTDVTVTAGTGISLSGTSSNLTITNTVTEKSMREESFTATAGQTNFTIAYTAPAVSGTSVPVRVYRNGVRLFWVASAPTSTQFTYSGTTVTTASNTSGDIITIEYLN